MPLFIHMISLITIDSCMLFGSLEALIFTTAFKKDVWKLAPDVRNVALLNKLVNN